MSSALPPLESRSCNACTLCCRLPDIDDLEKPADEWCRHCIAGEGCSIYAERPKLCRDFLCRWMTDDRLGDEWDPLTSHMMVYGQGQQTTVLADPDYPDLWRQEPYMSQLEDWAANAAPRGGYVIVFWRDEVVKIGA